MFVVIAYDVASERTEKYRKLLSRYLLSAQYSVFLGDVTSANFKQLSHALKQLLEDQDDILVVSAENRRNVSIHHWDIKGQHQSNTHLGSMIL